MRDAEKLMQIDRTHTYHKVYHAFLRFFKERGRIDEHVLIISANMVYGWMPRILDLHEQSSKFSEVADLLERARTDERLSISDLEKVKITINRSVVGTSKLLHFINPKRYPIWDSRVCNFINSKSDDRHRKAQEDNVSHYMCYVANCDELVQQDEFSTIHNSVTAKIGYEVSAYRSVELIMYEAGKAT